MNFSVTELTQALLASYRRHGGINYLDGVNLPSKGAVVDITRDLLRLVFPGFFDDKVIHSAELQAETALLLDSIAGRLEDEIYKSLRCFDCADEAKRDPRQAAHMLTAEFLLQLPRVRELLQTDVEAAFTGDPAARNREEIIVAYPFVEAIAVQRLAHELHARGVPLLPRIMTEWAHSRTGADMAAQRSRWHEQLAGVPGARLEFVDESGANTKMTRLYGRSPPGRRLVAPSARPSPDQHAHRRRAFVRAARPMGV